MSAHPHRKIIIPLISVLLGMTAMAWAAVPLYDLFCRVTGFGGRPLVAEASDGRILDREVTIRFNASTARDMPWEFKPEKPSQKVRIGETALAFYDAKNTTDRPITGTATYNVTPPIVGGYFVKIDCFCFTEQTLMPGESMKMPVTFYVDPDIMDDRQAGNIGTITLSYTFFETEPTRAALDTSRSAEGG